MLTTTIALCFLFDLALGGWPRWETRVVDCTKPDSCTMVDHLDVRHECRKEDDRWMCPLRCPDAGRTSAVLKTAYEDYQKCLNYYTYGQERLSDDHYMWVKHPPCTSNITTWCQYNDVDDAVQDEVVA